MWSSLMHLPVFNNEQKWEQGGWILSVKFTARLKFLQKVR